MVLKSVFLENKLLVGGFNPFEKYWSNWITSPGGVENKKYLKPPARINMSIFCTGCSFGPFPISHLGGPVKWGWSTICPTFFGGLGGLTIGIINTSPIESKLGLYGCFRK